MSGKIFDAVSKLKAKIGGDELDQKLIEAVSEQNWQASTQLLHQIANAAYNYEKWQKINEFIWDKLKKSKSWRKILKTFNLIEFLLKNGPPSIISNFKYDIYQLRTFESYSQYSDGVDKAEPIRERAKAVVGLLGNEELLEEERVKAKNIRQKMSNVVGGVSYGSSSAGSNSGPGYYGGSWGSKTDNDSKKNKQNQAYNYGNTNQGYFGDYNQTKSAINKYKDAPKPTNTNSTTSTTNPNKPSVFDEKKSQLVVETKKAFQSQVKKLQKPGAKKEEKPQEIVTVNKQNNQNNIIDDDFLIGTAPPQPTVVQQAPIQQQIQQQQQIPFEFTSNQPAVQKPVQAQQPTQPIVQPQQANNQQLNYNQQPQVYNQQQPQVYNQQQPQVYNQQQPQVNAGNTYQNQPNIYNQYGQPQQPNVYGQPNAYGQQANTFGQQPNFYNQQQNAYGQQQNVYGQPTAYNNAYGGYPPQNGQPQLGNLINPMYAQTAPMVANQLQQQKQQQPNLNISLNQPKKKDDDEFGGFTSSNNGTQNVNWLNNNEKGLIDFSDLSEEIKKGNGPSKQKNQNEPSNNITIDAWSW